LELTIKESAGTDNTIVYDTTKWTATFAPENGEYVAKLTADPVSAAETVTFANEYDEPVYQVVIPVTKTMSDEGDPLLEDKTFRFSVKAEEVQLSEDFSQGYRGQYLELDTQNKAVFYLTVPAGAKQSRAAIVLKGTAADFEALEFTIVEENTGDETVTYDGTAWNLAFEAVDGGYASVITKKAALIQNLLNEYTEAEFINEYDEPIHSMTIPVTKKLTGDNVGKKTEFTFQISAYWQDFDGMSAEDLSEDFRMEVNGAEIAAGGRFTITVPKGEQTASASIVITGTEKDFAEVLYGLYVSEDTSAVPKYWDYDKSMWWVAPGNMGTDGIWNAQISDSERNPVDAVVFINEYDLPEEECSPKTGDESRLLLWALMMVGSVAVLGTVLTVSKKRRQN